MVSCGPGKPIAGAANAATGASSGSPRTVGRNKMWRVLALTILALSVASLLPGHAAAGDIGVDAAQGTMSTRSFAQLPPGTAIAIELGEDTDLNNRLLPFIVRQVEELGFRSAPKAAYVLAFDARVISRASTKPRFRLHGSGGSDGFNELDMTLGLPSNEDQPPLWGTRYRLNFMLKRGGEPPLWVGAAVVDLSRADWFTVQCAMATRLLDAFGKTVEQRPITVF